MSRMLEIKETRNVDFSLVFNKQTPKAATSEVEDLMQVIEDLFNEYSYGVRCGMIQYYDSHVAVAFTGFNLFSDTATKAIHQVKLELSQRLSKEISIAVEQNAGTVWIRR